MQTRSVIAGPTVRAEFHLKAILRSLVSEYNRQNYPFGAVAGSGGSWRYGRTFPARARAGMDDRNGKPANDSRFEARGNFFR